MRNSLNHLSDFPLQAGQAPQISPDQIWAGRKTLAEISLKAYIEQAWHIVEPKAKLVWNWHLDVFCSHLTAVTNTFIINSKFEEDDYTHPVFPDPSIPPIQYLWINVHPRSTKSLVTSVFWPTWEWGPVGLPQMQYLFMAYAQDLSTRDSRKRRNIIRSDWYQCRWGDRFILTGDQNAKIRYENDKTGYMISSSVGGLGTGEGGNRCIIDDAHNTKEAESDAKRKSTVSWWDETMSSRLNNEKTDAYVGIMQRCHQQDLSGHVLEKAKGGELDNFAHVCIPGRYEVDHPFLSNSPIPIPDPRTEEGEPMDEGRPPTRMEKRMSAFAVAGQIQQRPTIKGGQIFAVDMLHLVDRYHPPLVVKTVRYWDKAGTEDGGKRTAGVKIARINHRDYDYIVLDIVTGQWEAGPRERRIKQVAELDAQQAAVDGKHVRTYIEQEPGSGGKESAQNTMRETLAGFACYPDRPTGDKFDRMDPLASAVYNGRVAVLKKPWSTDFIGEMENCGPGAAFVDRCDAAAGGFNKLAQMKTAGVWGRS